jgi:ABC-type multidrug transport system ATPase subunit
MLTVNKFICTVQEKFICSGESLRIAPARVTVLLGTSGSGKTRLLKGIAGLTDEVSGTVNWQEKSVTAPLYNVIQMGMLFQNNALLDGLTVEENLQLAAVKDDESITAGLDHLGLSSCREMYPGELSEGMKRRVALLRAGLGQPQLILLDEPLAGLDGVAREKVLVLVSRWQKAGCCLLLSTHILAGLDKLDACYYVIADGKLQGEYNTLSEVKEAQPEQFRESDEI